MTFRRPSPLSLALTLPLLWFAPASRAADAPPQVVATAKSKAPKPTPIVHGTKVNGQYKGRIEIWSTATAKAAEGEFNNGKADGTWSFWDDDGTKIAELNYRDGTFNGSVTMWQGTAAGPRARGKLKLRGSFVDGMWQGSVLTYYPDGRDRSERIYDQDEITAAYAYDIHGRAMPAAQAKKVATSDERVDNAFVDALDGYVRTWVK